MASSRNEAYGGEACRGGSGPDENIKREEGVDEGANASNTDFGIKGERELTLENVVVQISINQTLSLRRIKQVGSNSGF
jgi:hypothetical protein